MTRFWTTFGGSSRDGSRRPISAGCSFAPTAPHPPGRRRRPSGCRRDRVPLRPGARLRRRLRRLSARRQAGRAVRIPGADAGGGDLASPSQAAAVGGRARRDGRVRRARPGIRDGRSRGECRLGLRPGRKRDGDRGSCRDARSRAHRAADVMGAVSFARRLHGVCVRPRRLPRRRHGTVAPDRAVRSSPWPPASRSPAETARPRPTRFAPPRCSHCSRARSASGTRASSPSASGTLPSRSPSRRRSWPPPHSTCRG